MKPLLPPKQKLFYHINSYWLHSLQAMCIAHPHNKALKILHGQIIRNIISGDNNPQAWKDGYTIGQATASHYYSTGNFELPQTTILSDDDYTEYLRTHIHAWAVPLSYSYLSNKTSARLDKKLNLWGSTKSHTKYFLQLIEMIAENLKKDKTTLPVGFVDVGCGDGSLLRELKEHLKNVFKKEFIFIGVDIDEQSLQTARETDTENIIFIQGDVAKPEAINQMLIAQGLPSLGNFFHVRAFVDHNCKPFSENGFEEIASNISDYYYLHNNDLISKNSVENAFGIHFSKWKKYIQKHGLGIIELHKTEHYSLTESPAIAYEIFHLLSEQYMLSYRTYSKLLTDASFELINSTRLPQSNNPNVSISIYK